MSLNELLGFSRNPFEHYTAETEPDISSYAVRPPYLKSIVDRAKGVTSFVLFGDRGAGKSATRIKVYNELWSQLGHTAERLPFVVNVTEFSKITSHFSAGSLDDRKIVEIVAFNVIEQLFVWLASLEEDEREIYLEALNGEERSLVLALTQGFYLNVPALDRSVSTSDAMRLLNAAWATKSLIWINKRWDSVARIFASVLAALSKKHLDHEIDISAPAERILASLKGETPNAARAILARLVEMAQAFGFSGVCIFIDKIDETSVTSSSAEATARFIYPLLSHVQLLEVSGCSFVVFLWSKVQTHFMGKHSIRLDKIAHTNITWSVDGLREMVDARVSYYSNRSKRFEDLFEPTVDVGLLHRELVRLTVKSPRELIRLLDVICREHAARGAEGLIDKASIDIGCDKYVTETIGSWYPEKSLKQILRLGRVVFANKDVQTKFKIGDQGARVKIQGWVEAGLVRQDGTVPNETGGKPAYRFVIDDPRIIRIVEGRLDQLVGAEVPEDEAGDRLE